MEFSFPRTYGQQESRERLSQALAQGRFPHALLVHGEPGLGQHALLLDLAQILSCESTDTKPCDNCYACKAFLNASLESLLYLFPIITPNKSEDKELNEAQLEEIAKYIPLWHENPYGFSFPEKAVVRVMQSRELLRPMGFSKKGNLPRIVFIPYFEVMGDEASNALLKMLEEPPTDTYFLIATENRAALMPTLLSRCMHLGLSPLSPTEFRETAAALSAKVGKSLSERLLPFAEGSPGVYLDLLENGGEGLLEETANFLAAATAPDWRIFADYAATVEGLEDAADLLQFLLRCVRVHQSMKARHAGPMKGREDGYRWTAQALEAEGWEASLSVPLGPLEDVANLPAFTAYLQTALQAVRGYSQPKIALLGLFLEYERASTPLHAGHGGNKE